MVGIPLPNPDNFRNARVTGLDHQGWQHGLLRRAAVLRQRRSINAAPSIAKDSVFQRRRAYTEGMNRSIAVLLFTPIFLAHAADLKPEYSLEFATVSG
jgi:hypothetical protein